MKNVKQWLNYSRPFCQPGNCGKIDRYFVRCRTTRVWSDFEVMRGVKTCMECEVHLRTIHPKVDLINRHFAFQEDTLPLSYHGVDFKRKLR